MAKNISYGIEYLDDRGEIQEFRGLTKIQMIEKLKELKKDEININGYFKYQTSRGRSKSPYREQWGRKQYLGWRRWKNNG